MSKSNNDYGNLSDVINLINDMKQGNDVDPISQTLFKELLQLSRELRGDIKDIKELNKSDKGDIKKLITSYMKERGVTFTNSFNTKMDLLLKELSKVSSSEKRKVSDEDLYKAMANYLSSATIQSASAINRGKPNDALLKGIGEDEKQKDFLKEINSAMGKSNDGIWYKIQTFFGTQFKESKKTLIGLGASIVEGLAKNKFIGGALADTIKLFGLLGGSWLAKHFGEAGKKIGAGLFAIAQVISGLLPALLIGGIGNLLFGGKLTKLLGGVFKFGFSSLGTLLKNSFGFLKSLPSAIMNLGKFGANAMKGISSLGAGAFANLGKIGLGAAKGVGGLVAGLALDAGANFAVKKGVNASVAYGVSGAGQGAITGAMLGSIFPVLGPIVGAGVGAAIGGITGIIKGFREDSKEHNKATEEDAKSKHSFWQGVINWFKSIIPWGNKGSSSGSTGEDTSGSSTNFVQKAKNFVGNVVQGAGNILSNLGANLITGGSQDLKAVRKIGSLGINQYGQMTNIGSMTQNQASKAIRDYMQQDRASFDKNYEILDSKYAAFGAYKNDAVLKDDKGKIIGVLAAKGTKDRMDYFRSRMVERGVPTSVANQFVLTGGMSTKTSPHKVGSVYSHSNIAGEAYDFAIPQGAYAKTMFDVVRKSAWDQGFDARWEGYDKQGNFKFLTNYQEGFSNAHIDMKRRKGFKATPVALRSPAKVAEVTEPMSEEVAQKVQSEAADLLWREDREAYNKLSKQYGKSFEEEAEMYQEELKKYGIVYDSKGVSEDGQQGRWLKKSLDDGNTYELADLSGNRDFARNLLTLVQISNYGG